MKHFILAPTLILIFAAFAFSQERPRYFDNFDTPVGVQVHYPPSPPVEAYAMTTQAPNARSNRPAVNVDQSPAVDNRSGKRTVRVIMTVTDGFAQRETQAREVQSYAAANRLMMGSGNLLQGFTTGDILIDTYIVDSSRRYSIDPLLIYAQMAQESSFKLRATSNKGASGLMQLMPATARRMGVANIYDPKQNIEGGVKYMRLLLDMFSGDISLALAGYNAGEGAVIKYGYQIPPYNETQDYVRRISSRYQAFSSSTTARNKRPASAVRESAPSNMYQPRPATVQLADGSTRLVNR